MFKNLEGKMKRFSNKLNSENNIDFIRKKNNNTTTFVQSSVVNKTKNMFKKVSQEISRHILLRLEVKIIDSLTRL